ncbi:hypothetical protein [Bacillus cereus]|uniref:hypothetical protein n=1 Tax=Bacillus cereus TaxID=1396 RepID=UPI00141A2E19|nr:hypothetical protein [Bacillus cereus]
MNFYSYPNHMFYYHPQYTYPEFETITDIDPRQQPVSEHPVTHSPSHTPLDLNCISCNAALRWNSRIRYLSEALGSIGELKLVISDELKKMGFSNVNINESEVSGEKDRCWVSIAHFYIAGREFREIVMCSSTNYTKAKMIVDHIVTMINGLKFL